MAPPIGRGCLVDDAAVAPKPKVSKWQTLYGSFVQMSCKDPVAASSAIALKRAAYLKGGDFVHAEAFAKFTSAPTPPYGTRPLPGADSPSNVAWLALYPSEGAAKQKELPSVLALGATGTPSDLEVLETPMYVLERAGAGSGVNYAIMLCAQAKDADAAQALVEVAKGEIALNIEHEPLFLRGVVIPPTPDEPLRVRWTVQWASLEGVKAHTSFPHHKEAGPRLFPLMDMAAWGGGLEYDRSFHFSRKSPKVSNADRVWITCQYGV